MPASATALLARLVDYAGLFPPAGLDMPAAVQDYAAYMDGPHAWMLGRFIVPASRMEEFENAASQWLKKQTWKIGILGFPNQGFSHPLLVVDAIEIKPERPGDIQSLAWDLPVYFEIPSSPGMQAYIEAIRLANARAKIRTGGLTAESVPSGAAVVRFLVLCNQANVAFKATAGLHHAIQGIYSFDGDSASDRGAMHGFLNLFLAAAFLHAGASEEDAARILAEPSGHAFQFHNDAVYWGPLHLTLSQVESARRSFAISFGSCSFLEPVHDLGDLGLL